MPGQLAVSPGVILVGEPGDTLTRPAWAKDGAFMAFRQLKQLVPEWNKFIAASAPAVPGLTPAQSADLLGARLIGRWKSVRRKCLDPLRRSLAVAGSARGSLPDGGLSGGRDRSTSGARRRLEMVRASLTV